MDANLKKWLTEIGLGFEAREDGNVLVRMPVLVEDSVWMDVKDMPADQRAELDKEILAAGGKALADDEDLLAATITTNRLDRYRDIVEAKGANLKDYKKNPVVLWAHNGGLGISEPPIGTAVKLDKQPDRINALIRFSKVTERALEVAALYREGTLRAFSIGFLPGTGKNDVEVMKNEKDEFTGYRFKKWDLLEFSAVPVPANPDALVNSARVRAMDLTDPIFELMLDELGDEDAANVLRGLGKVGEIVKPVDPPKVNTGARRDGLKQEEGGLEIEIDDVQDPDFRPKEKPAGTGEKPEGKVAGVNVEIDANLTDEAKALLERLEKAGAVLNKANKDKLKNAQTAIGEVLASAEKPDEGDDEDDKNKGKFTCECIDCGYTMETDEHCKDIKCPECGGQMRRAERPGPGQKDTVEYWKAEAKKAFAERDKERAQKRVLLQVIGDFNSAATGRALAEEEDFDFEIEDPVNPTPPADADDGDDGIEIEELDSDALRKEIVELLGEQEKDMVAKVVAKLQGRLPKE